MATTQVSEAAGKSLWHNANFILLWSGQLVSQVGSRISALGKTTKAGAVLAFLGDALTYLVSVFSRLFIRVAFQGERQAQKLKKLWPNIMEGLRFVWAQRHLR